MSLHTRYVVVAALLLVVSLCGADTAVAAGASMSVHVVLTSTADNDASGGITLGDKLFYTTTATNTGSVSLTNVRVNNSVGALGSNCNLAPNATCVMTNSYVVQQNDVNGGAVVNYGRATANEISGAVTDALITPFFGNTLVVIIEEAAPDAALNPTQGDVLHYAVIMGHHGFVGNSNPLTNVQVSDPSLTPSTINCASVAVGGNCVLNGTYTVTATDVAQGFISQTATATSNEVAHTDYTLRTPVFGGVQLVPVLQSKTISGAPTTKDSTRTVLSADGKVVLFESQENDLVANNTNTNGQDIYRVVAGQTVLENIDNAGHQLMGTSSLPTVSGNGSIVAFAHAPGMATQAKDTVTSNMWAGSNGQPKHQVDMGIGGAAPNGSTSGAPSVSSAGGSNKLVFCSSASNLVPGDANGVRDIFMVDPLNPAVATQRISTDSTGTPLPGDSCEPRISADGNKVVFTISASSLFGTSTRQVVRKDLGTGVLELISVSTSGASQGANADSLEPAINADGSVVAFTSQASDLDSLGTPVGGREAFVSLAQSSADSVTRMIKRLRGGDGTVPNGSSQHPQLSCNGTTAVMQTSATNLLGSAPGQCGAVAITTNFFSVSLLGGSLCPSAGGISVAIPAISCDGTTTAYDSNAPQPNTASSNSNAYSQITGNIIDITGNSVANLSGDFSGQWFDPNQSGQGLVIDVTNPDASNNRLMILTWFVFSGGQPTWVQGVGVPKAGAGSAANTVVVQMDQVAIFQGISFPLGAAHATGSVWGSIALTFTDANTGTMRWASGVAGFGSGSMPIKHFLSVALPSQDAAGAQVKSCFSGNWFNPAQSGHGFELEVLGTSPAFLSVDWFAFAPSGAPVWLQGAGQINGNSAQIPLQLIDGTGAQFPPNFNPTQITHHDWGTATFTFTDSAHATVSWNSTVPGYGSGSQPLQPIVTGLMDRRACQ